MKIVGLTYYDGRENMVLKSDSSLLVNRKPLFVPEQMSDLRVLPCTVLRVSRLGKCIAPKFASRYYDAIAPGLDFYGADLLREAQAAGSAWTEAVAFENSLAVGSWSETGTPAFGWEHMRGNTTVCRQTAQPDAQLLDQAVARISRLLTIRQGDLIYLAYEQQPWQLQTEDVLRCVSNDTEQLYCKIK